MKKKSRSENAIRDAIVAVIVMAAAIAGAKLLDGWSMHISVGVGFVGVFLWSTRMRVVSYTSTILAGIGGAAIGTMVGSVIDSMLSIDPAKLRLVTLLSILCGAGATWLCMWLLLRAEDRAQERLLQSFSIPRTAKIEMVVPKGVSVPIGVAVAAAREGEPVEVDLSGQSVSLGGIARGESDSLGGVSLGTRILAPEAKVEEAAPDPPRDQAPRA